MCWRGEDYCKEFSLQVNVRGIFLRGSEGVRKVMQSGGARKVM